MKKISDYAHNALPSYYYKFLPCVSTVFASLSLGIVLDLGFTHSYSTLLCLLPKAGSVFVYASTATYMGSSSNGVSVSSGNAAGGLLLIVLRGSVGKLFFGFTTCLRLGALRSKDSLQQDNVM